MKVVLNDVTNLSNPTSATGTINDNSQIIEDAFDNTLSRDGSSPNEMNAELDMNSNAIDNLPKAVSPLQPVRLKEFNEAVIYGVINPGMQNIDTIADLNTVQPAITPGTPGVVVGGYYVPGDGGGGILLYDDSSVATVDNGMVFSAPPLVGRFTRPDDGIYHSKWFGIRHDGTDPGSLNAGKLQNMINACQNYKSSYRKQMMIDPGAIECSGGEIWINPDGNAFSSSAGNTFTMRGVSRRDSRILGVYATFGKFYRLVSGVPVYDITRDPTNAYNIDNVHFEGCIRFINIEGAPIVSNCGFFASPTLNYGAFPSDWGIGPGDGTITTHYSAITHVVEVLACNHIQWINNNVLNGNQISANLSGALFSQDVNTQIIGGRFNANRKALSFDAHPVYGSRISETARVLGPHFESNTEEAIYLMGAQQAYIDAHIRGSAANWDAVNFSLVNVGTNASQDIHIGGAFTGYSTSAGSAIQTDSVNGLTLEGKFQRFRTVAFIGNNTKNYNLERVYYSQINTGTEFIFGTNTVPYRRPITYNIPLTNQDVVRNYASFNEDFLDTTLSSRWVVTKGSNASAANFAIVNNGAGGLLQGTTGNAGSGTMALNGIQVSGAQLNWLPSKGGLRAEFSLYMNNTTNLALFFGFTDQNSVLEMPVTYSGTTVTANATDCVGFIYDTNSTNDLLTMVGVKNGTPVSIESTLTPQANILRKFIIEIDSNGIANFYRDGVLLGVSELVLNGNFVDTSTWTFGSGWAADTTNQWCLHTTGNTADLTQSMVFVAGQSYTVNYRIGGRTTGSVTPSFQGTTTVTGTSGSSNLPFTQSLVAAAGNNLLVFTPSTDFNGYITDISVVKNGLNNAVTASVPLTPVIAGFTYTGQRIFTCDFITIQQNR